jgi:hypothetical protein
MAKPQGRVAAPSYSIPVKSHPNNSTGTKQQAPLTRGTRWQQRTWNWVGKTYKGQFTLQAGAIVLLAILLALISSQVINRSATDLNVISNGSIPSVEAAQTMAQYVEDIDAKAADYLAAAGLTNKITCTLPGPQSSAQPLILTVHDCDDRTITTETQLFDQQLYEAIHNVTYPGERTAVERITTGFEEYTSDITLMRSEYTQAQSKTNPQDPHLRNAWQDYLAATSVLHNKITWLPPMNSTGQIIFDEPHPATCTLNGKTVPATIWAAGSLEANLTCLNNINESHLNAAYNDTQNFLRGSILLLLVCCLGFVALLLFSTGRMAMITHRIVNIGLTSAFLVSIIFSASLLLFSNSMAGRHGDFGQIVRDDDDSMYYAAELNRYGTMANADESRWLIALEFGDQSQVTHWSQDWQKNTAQVRALITRAQNNRTWPQEDQPLADMQTNWQRYTQIDPQIRTLAENTANPQHILNAEKLSTGQSNTTFGQFENAVNRLSQANALHYQMTLTATQNTLTDFTFWCIFLFPLIGLAAAWGILHRFKDL